MPEEKDLFNFEPIKGYPMLNWKGKRPYKSTQYFPAQLKESFGEQTDNWLNKIFWGDNLQVMSHLLKKYRGKVNLIYIDPPFDSKADYKKTIHLKGKTVGNDHSAFEEKQYTDIWSNDEYLQFMYERLILMRELLADNGSIYVHCDWRKNHHLRLVLDEVFGADLFNNEIIWKRRGGSANPTNQYDAVTDTLLWYGKTNNIVFNQQYSKNTDEAQKYIEERFNNNDGTRKYMKSPIVSPNYRKNLIYNYKGYKSPPNGWSISVELMEKWDKEGKLYFPEKGERIYRKIYLDEYPGQPVQNLWIDIYVINPMANERLNYPTQKPEALIERIIKASSNPGDLVFDCFMGSGTTQAVAMKLGRRFIGADSNLGAVQTTTKRLIAIQKELNKKLFKVVDGEKINNYYTSFEIYTIDKPNFFKKEIEAIKINIENNELVIKHFYSKELLKKLGCSKNTVDWKRMVESIMIDWNYDNSILKPTTIDIPKKKELVRGCYTLPEKTKKILVKITDLLSKSFIIEIKK